MAKKNKKNSIQRLDLNRARSKKDKDFHNGKSEQAVATYLGYQTLEEFRKFKFSHFIVEADRLDTLDFLGIFKTFNRVKSQE
ncbi:MAG: hypothetical protein GOMPHAMPRED_001699 [Gomphillus americanus]|uniref:Uncharacterized protein n=1 Tax=Gomphillus americanus TaxID=1940652 RepID=A0A8H3IHR4_9LECA|nr:MAG: hypothetical protein GOMPHAMPRED_001699 [Gomphillus americanus]